MSVFGCAKKMANERVWMCKETGDLYEAFAGFFGPIIAWEDLTHPDRKHTPITAKSPLKFDDEYDADEFEDLGEL